MSSMAAIANKEIGYIVNWLHIAAFSIGLALLILGCSSSHTNNNDDVTFVAEITTDEQDTTVQLVKLTNNGTDTPIVDLLHTFNMGYGAMPFLENRGRVPYTQFDMPPKCTSSDTLGLDDALPCVVAPLLARLDLVIGQFGLSRNNVVLTGVFNTNNNENHTQSLIDKLSEVADKYAESLNYMSDIVYTEEVEN